MEDDGPDYRQQQEIEEQQQQEHEDMNKSENINELAAALAKAQLEVENASKTSANPHFKSRYADLAEILNTVRPVLAANGLSVVQLPSYEHPNASVETVLMHSSGQFIGGKCSAPVSKPDAQGVGSAITYLRRYSLAAVCGIAQEDDDAASASGSRQHGQPTQQPQRQTAPRQSYSDEQFSANFPTWQKLIEGGKKTAADIIAMVESKAPLTDEQKKKINAVKASAQEAAQ